MPPKPPKLTSSRRDTRAVLKLLSRLFLISAGLMWALAASTMRRASALLKPMRVSSDTTSAHWAEREGDAVAAP